MLLCMRLFKRKYKIKIEKKGRSLVKTHVMSYFSILFLLFSRETNRNFNNKNMFISMDLLLAPQVYWVIFG